MFEIGVDIGGTNIKYGLVNEALEIVAHGSIPFPKTTAMVRKHAEARWLPP